MARRPRTFADPAKVEPHVPIHTALRNTCGQCNRLIGFSADHDPVHAVPRQCACGTTIPPFSGAECQPCFDRRWARHMQEVEQRLATYDGKDEGEVIPERKPKGDPAPPDPLKKKLYAEAVQYLRQWNGDFPFLKEMKAKLDAPSKYEQKLSDGQVAAILRCKEADEKRAKEAEERRKNGLDLTVLPEGTTRYAVDNAAGEVTFIRVDRPMSGKWEGWVFVKQIVGGGLPGVDNEHRLGAQRPGDAYRGSFENLLRAIVADPLTAAIRYGLELGQCSDCGRTLTNAESREFGIGPKCRAKWEKAA